MIFLHFYKSLKSDRIKNSILATATIQNTHFPHFCYYWRCQNGTNTSVYPGNVQEKMTLQWHEW